MDYKCIINNKNVVLSGKEDERLRDVLYRNGYNSVRDSDDREGFAVSGEEFLEDDIPHVPMMLEIGGSRA